MRDLTFPALDGFEIAATCYGESATRVLLIAPATGVKRRLYNHFANHFADRGYRVLTWDWRGTGDSRPARLRGFSASMADWGRHDLGGAIRWARERFPDAQMCALGHSFGGQGLGLAPNAGELEGVVTVASQSGYWRLWPGFAKYRYAALWYVVMPLVTRTIGFMPGRAVGFGEDLPKGVALEWARWCRRPEYLGDYSGHAAMSVPLLSLAFADDPFAPEAAVHELHRRYSSASRRHRTVSPKDYGLDRIGHFGFFRPEARALWDEVAEWLDGEAGHSSRFTTHRSTTTR